MTRDKNTLDDVARWLEETMPHWTYSDRHGQTMPAAEFVRRGLPFWEPVKQARVFDPKMTVGEAVEQLNDLRSGDDPIRHRGEDTTPNKLPIGSRELRAMDFPIVFYIDVDGSPSVWYGTLLDMVRDRQALIARDLGVST